MRVLIIANPIVGINRDKRAVIQKIASSIIDKGGNVDITYTMKPGVGNKHSSRAALEGYDAVYAAGGDGTINDVASGLINRPTPLGIIPLGTGNGLARALGIPFETDKLLEMLLAFRTTAIDVGKISSRFFLATAGLGYDASIAYDFNLQQKSWRKLHTYFFLAVKHYFMKNSENLTLIINGKEIKRKVFALTATNTSQYGGGAIIAPQADPRSGTLIAVLIPKFNIFQAIPAVIKLFNGSINKFHGIEYYEFETMKIIREKAGLYHVDGEAFEDSATTNVKVLPHSLNIITP
ncbi:MAG: YegS/Rv2252/BmrU family lipid kinase [Candidatus Latescibacteria bacterium]|nr:YegS/Rv2252/BmrU family lipid kinase [Candidatus Latescibacterota bacterium]